MNISIHTASEGGDIMDIITTKDTYISIHTASEGGDEVVTCINRETGISIHTASEGGDKRTYGDCRMILTFQSTPPAKAVTIGNGVGITGAWHFNPHRQRRR